MMKSTIWKSIAESKYYFILIAMVLSAAVFSYGQDPPAEITKLGDLLTELIKTAKEAKILMPTISATGQALFCVDDKDKVIYCTEGVVHMKEVKDVKYSFQPR